MLVVDGTVDGTPLVRFLPADRVLKAAFFGASALALALIGGAMFGPATLRPTLIVFTVLVVLMAVGAKAGSRRIWLLLSVINNLALILFFK